MKIMANSESKRASHRSSSSRAAGTHQRRTRLIQILGVALAFSLLINLLIAIALGNYSRKASLLSGVSDSLRLQLSDSAEQLARNALQLKTLENEIKELTLNRLPGLTGLHYDEVLNIDKLYVKNIVFTRTGKKGARVYEYKVVLDNHDSALQPAFKIVLFDRSGVQVGMSELSHDTVNGGMTRLDQDEVRVHYSMVPLADIAEPEYFQVILL
ncbi:hypothetical protein A9Q89_11825 [Gammaproteobacteria bacterium 53_120_T64]|nr:hypothetical protein A9Q89_11825 [Gammaproteobacteria bacterium 53_120_T64]